MPYATPADLYAQFSETEILRLADRNVTADLDSTEAAAARAAVLDAALERAHIRVNGIIGDRIRLIESDPETLAALKYPTCDLARYYLYDDLATDQVRERRDDALKTLQAIRDGAESLGKAEADATGATLAAADTIQITSQPNLTAGLREHF